MATGPIPGVHDGPGVADGVDREPFAAMGAEVGTAFAGVTVCWMTTGVGEDACCFLFPCRLLMLLIRTVTSTGTDKNAVMNSKYFFLSGSP